jgi:hypothetical protein
MVNSRFQIYNKQGNAILLDQNGNPAPRAINQLWKNFGGLCETTNRGDPVVLYDPLADRWMLSQFAFNTTGTPPSPIPPYEECIAVSKTGDPVSVEFIAPAAGQYPIACSEFCGSGHGQMKAALLSVAAVTTTR